MIPVDELSDEQKKMLVELLTNALIEIRYLGWRGKAQQAADLADAVHNLPRYLWGTWEFDWSNLLIGFKSYHEKYPDRLYDYLKMIRQIQEM